MPLCYCLQTDVVLEKYLPSFSMIKWDDISPYFIRSLDMTLYDDHRSIRPYILKRSRIPLDVFKTLCEQLDRSPITLGERRDLENEAAVQLYIHPVYMFLSMGTNKILDSDYAFRHVSWTTHVFASTSAQWPDIRKRTLRIHGFFWGKISSSFHRVQT